MDRIAPSAQTGEILITGATGFLGSRIARLLLEKTVHRLALLVRGADDAEARLRLERIWSDWPEALGEIGKRVRVIRGDLSLPLLGIDPVVYSSLVGRVTHIIHAAAELKLDGEIEALRRTNVEGTRNLLLLARAAHADHGLARFSHVSTAYVAGGRTGEVREEDLDGSCGFSNGYEQTKFEGELLARSAMADLPISIFRPGMVVGDSLTGEIQSFNTVYVPLRLYLTGRLRLVPSRPEMRLNIVPVDYVAAAIARLTFDARATGLTFHLTVASERLPETRELLMQARAWAEVNLDEAPRPPRFVPLSRLAGSVSAASLGIPSFLLSYFGENRSFRRDNTERLLGSYAPDWRTILPRLLEYAVKRGFLRRTGRTVHEQVLHRLSSPHLPVRVHDVVNGVSFVRRGPDLAREIQEARAALASFGVDRGDRVAIVGLNSSRFLSLDTAIGLCGAVSVPLYYTAPTDEIEAILDASGAKLLLVGAPAVLERIGRISDRTTVVSFGSSDPPRPRSEGIIPWEEFIKRGASARDAAPPLAPVGFSDIATLRFTSGTTGDPKGAAFAHDQLRWMAETLVSLLPWKARTTPARYLSFLPMNHVVEGILGSYAPAFFPAPVDVFFLEDFQALARVLPKVRPTVFFSIPRFYEKLWERFSLTRAARIYQGLPATGAAGVLRRGLKVFLRRSLLIRAGLDRCEQLLAGSAPFPDQLLESFHALGIEIHNAYGLTEAPLVSLNRCGANRRGSVGTPLPATEVRIAPDGEVLVRGPQVTRGYFDRSGEGVFHDGWLCTGDLGGLSPDGSLIISGRKKDILITSYGKNVHPAKIEGMLRRIPGLADALVVGDNRPSLAALLWLKKEVDCRRDIAEIERSIRLVNEGLSHPEQVRRWAFLAEHPQIENGELTGNLKIRRQAVLLRRAEVVEMLYAGGDERTPGVLRVGGGRCA